MVDLLFINNPSNRIAACNNWIYNVKCVHIIEVETEVFHSITILDHLLLRFSVSTSKYQVAFMKEQPQRVRHVLFYLVLSNPFHFMVQQMHSF